jgi:hypothetical protein
VVNELPQVALEVADTYIEFNIISVKSIGVEIQKIMALDLELYQYLPKVFYQSLHSVEAVLGQGGKLVNRLKHVNQLVDTAAEQIEAPKNEGFTEVELLSLGQTLKCFLCFLVLLLVSIVELDA